MAVNGHTIRSTTAKNSTLHVNLMALCITEPVLWIVLKVLQCGIGIFNTFCSCNHDLALMTFVYKLDPYSLEIYRLCKYELTTSRLSKVIIWQTDQQTSRQIWPKLYTTQLHGRSKTQTTLGLLCIIKMIRCLAAAADVDWCRSYSSICLGIIFLITAPAIRPPLWLTYGALISV